MFSYLKENIYYKIFVLIYGLIFGAAAPAIFVKYNIYYLKKNLTLFYELYSIFPANLYFFLSGSLIIML